jgi:lipopolysaccharide assembly outer membrane protein LptD (OstA)
LKTATFYELVARCEELGLSIKGTRKQLESRLIEHFQLKEESTDAEEDAGTETKITIESARRSEYFTIEDVPNTYIRLNGGVVLQMNDMEKKVIHKIKADEIVFNETENNLTATGNIEYEMQRSEKTEVFRGESLTFEVDSWEGIFFNGISERNREIEGNTMNFSFGGEYITRAANDLIILDNGTITSSDADPPGYYVAAKRIWIFGPGEWGLNNAFLHVGRVPVFYFPFFFHPGDKLFFNPSLGSRSREGYFIQTTSYIIGEKPKSEQPFSFLQISEEEGEEYVRERDGLFLVKTKEKKEKKENEDWYLKVIADTYSKLGSFGAVEGHFSDIGSLKEIDFTLGIGASRNLYPTDSSLEYSPYWINENNEAESVWNNSVFLGLTLPFRYIIESKFNIKKDIFSFNGNFELLTDPFIKTDFFGRTENVDWGSILGMDEQEVSSPGEVSKLTWQISSSIRPKTNNLKPYIKSISINRLNVELGWRSDSVPVTPADTKDDVSPSRKYFYPQSLLTPETSMRISGSLYSYPKTEKSQKEEKKKSEAVLSDEELELFKPPWELEDENEAEDDQDDEWRLPGLQKDLPLPKKAEPLKFDISYDLSPKLTVEHQTDSEEWDSPEDVNFALDYSNFNTQNTGNINYSLKLYNNLFTMNGTLSMNANYQTYFNPSESIQESTGGQPSEWDNKLESAYNFTKLGTSNKINISSKPFRDAPNFQDTTLTYSLNTILYKREYNGVSDPTPQYQDYFIAFDEEYIKSHDLSMNLNFRMLQDEQAFKLSTTLPPLDFAVTTSFNLKNGPLTSSISTGIKQEDSEWLFQDLKMVENLTIGDTATLRETLIFDLDNGYFTTSSTSLGLGIFKFAFDAKRSYPYSFDTDSSSWVKADTESFIPVSASLSTQYKADTDPLWKNRISTGLNAGVNWKLNLQKFTDTTFNLTLKYSLKIHRFLDLSVSSSHHNAFTYQYFPNLAEQVGRTWKNPIVDLFKSINFFNIDHRYESFFNLSSISVKAVHYLDDWNLTFEYKGNPKLKEELQRYEWYSTFSIFLQWVPIPEIKRNFEVDTEGVSSWN